MAGIRWTKQEDDFLKKNYAEASFDLIHRRLKRRTHAAIILRAEKLGLKRAVVPSRIGSIQLLLEETPQAYYWAGFIAADGCILNGKRLSIALCNADKEHLEKFARFVQTKIRGNKTAVASIQDGILVPKFCKKFDLRPRKTYNPPSLDIVDDDLFLAFMAGFIDGDGSIGNIKNRKDNNLQIKLHSSWCDALAKMEARIYEVLGIPRRKTFTKINKQGYTYLSITNNKVIRSLKKRLITLELPLMERKWSKIDCSRVLASEKAEHNKRKVLAAACPGKTLKQISIETGLSQTGVWKILKKKEVQ